MQESGARTPREGEDGGREQEAAGYAPGRRREGPGEPGGVRHPLTLRRRRDGTWEVRSR